MISYRREDTGLIAGRICDRLRASFGADKVYMDIDSNPIGVDYRKHIDKSLGGCNILLAVIGPRWLEKDAASRRRIDQPNDLVRLELVSALKRDIPLVPLLIDDTKMPAKEEIPEELESLIYREAFRIDSGRDFHHHLDILCDQIAKHYASAESKAETSDELEQKKPPPLTATVPPHEQSTQALSEDTHAQSPPLPKPSPRSAGAAKRIIIAGYICAAISLFFLPPIFGIAGVVLGIIALKGGNTRHGTAIIILSFVVGLLGAILGATLALK